MIGPTAGYLLAFPIAALLVAEWLQHSIRPSIARTLSAFSAGTMLILLLGTSWLATFIPISEAVRYGLIPFLPGAVLKIAIAMIVVEKLRQDS